MTRQRWKLTQATPGQPEVDTWGSGLTHEHGRPGKPEGWPETVRTPAQFEFDLVAQMAKDPAHGLVEVTPGLYRVRPDTPCLFCIDREGNFGWVSGPC
jgi:hypothetical protein